MGQLFGATFPIITARVGEGGKKSGKEVKRINQLLRMAGFLKTDPLTDETWGKNSSDAMVEFNTACQVGPVTKYIDPKDAYDRLFTLALMAGVLIPLPSGLRSSSALTVLFDYCRSANYLYGWKEGDKVYNGGTHTIWGFEGRPSWAISTVKPGDYFTSSNPVTLNCTSFANLMMAAWVQGDAHSSPYDASQMVGGFDPLGDRYGVPAVNDNELIFEGFCFDADAFKGCMQPARLYYVGFTDSSGYIKHDTVAFNGEVYECNKNATPAVYKTEAKARFERNRKSRGGGVYIMGPFPF